MILGITHSSLSLTAGTAAAAESTRHAMEASRPPRYRQGHWSVPTVVTSRWSDGDGQPAGEGGGRSLKGRLPGGGGGGEQRATPSERSTAGH